MKTSYSQKSNSTFKYFTNLQVRHCQDLKIAKDKAAVLVGYIALSQTLGKIFYGRVADNPRVNRVYLYQMCLLSCSVLTTLLPVFTSYNSILAYCWLFGFNDGCFVVLIAVLTGDVSGPKYYASAYGLMYFITGFPMMFGPPVAGKNYILFRVLLSVWIFQVFHTFPFFD